MNEQSGETKEEERVSDCLNRTSEVNEYWECCGKRATQSVDIEWHCNHRCRRSVPRRPQRNNQRAKPI